jgi:dethiobiotin synthetase
VLAKTDGGIFNLSQWRLDSRPIPNCLPPVLIVAGTSMNAGKTTAAASLIKGLQRSGKRVGAAKVTGTGAGGDYWQMIDAGAVAVVDFTDAGHASTYLLAPQEVEQIFLRLIGHLAQMDLDAIVVEVADGILQPETAELLASPVVSHYSRGIVFAAGDSMGAVSGVEWLQRRGLHVHAVSGALTASPLAVRETTGALGIPVIGKKALADPKHASAILAACV